MFPEFYQPANNGQLSASLTQISSKPESRPLFQTVPINFSAEEIRIMVRDLLG